jgi:hypothetical protein
MLALGAALAGCSLPGPFAQASPTPAASPTPTGPDICPTSAPTGTDASGVEAFSPTTASKKPFRILIPKAWKYNTPFQLKAGQVLRTVRVVSNADNASLAINLATTAGTPEDTVNKLRDGQTQYTFSPNVKCKIGGDDAVMAKLTGKNADGSDLVGLEGAVSHGGSLFVLVFQNGSSDTDGAVAETRSILASWSWQG